MIEIIRKSIYAPRFYRELKEEPLSFSFKYFFSLVLILSVLLTGMYVVRLVPVVDAFLNKIGPTVVESIPEGAVITVKDGQARTNLDEPIVVPVPHDKLEIETADFPYENLFVLDAEADPTQEVFDSYDTLMLMTATELVAPDQEGGIETTTLEDIDMVLTKNDIAATVSSLQSSLQWLVPLMVLGIFLIIFFIFLWELVYLLFLALLIMVVGRIKKVELDYKHAYQAGLHAMTAGVLVLGLQILYPGFYIPFFFTLLTMVVVYINFGEVGSMIDGGEGSSALAQNEDKEKRDTSGTEESKSSEEETEHPSN